MKKSLMLLAGCMIMLASSVHAQFSMTFTAGVSPQQTPVSDPIFVNRSTPRDEFTFDVSQVKASYFVGAGAKYDVKPFFFTGEALYNKREYIYDIAYTFPAFGRTEDVEQYTENMHVINLPLSVGVDLGVVDVMSGFVPQMIVSQQSDMEDLPGYSDKSNFLRFGWQSGFAANVSNMRIGLMWQMDFNNYADHVYVREQNLSLQGRSARLLGTLSYHF